MWGAFPGCSFDLGFVGVLLTVLIPIEDYVAGSPKTLSLFLPPSPSPSPSPRLPLLKGLSFREVSFAPPASRSP